MNAYSALLKDPRWQRKRLEIMSRDNFTCVRCGDGKTELHVHHLQYISGHKPWEYPGSNFETLCPPCHKSLHSGEIPADPVPTAEPKPPETVAGIVVTWTGWPEKEISSCDAIPWTGRTMREDSPERPTIYICLDHDGNEFWIDASCGIGFLFPARFEVDKVTFEKSCQPLSPCDLFLWIEMIRTAVRQGERGFGQ